MSLYKFEGAFPGDRRKPRPQSISIFDGNGKLVFRFITYAAFEGAEKYNPETDETEVSYVFSSEREFPFLLYGPTASDLTVTAFVPGTGDVQAKRWTLFNEDDFKGVSGP